MSAPTAAPIGSAATPAAPATPQLIALSSAVAGPSFAVGDAEVTIGRSESSTIFDLAMQLFFFHDHTLSLGANEFRLLLHLRANMGRVCARESCVYAVWHTKIGVDAYRGALDQMVYQIRSKLQAIEPRANLIQTVRGEGYLLLS